MAISLWPLPRLVHSESSPVPSPKKSLSSLLRHYETPGISPPSSRVNPNMKPRESQPLRVWDLWKYASFITHKATELAADVLSHHIWGPRKKSWGIEMTIITSLMRDVSRHSSLVDIATIRLVMSLTGFVPLPSDALVTPVTFRVRKRSLRGILAEFDAQETDTRELSGEWVVGKKLWQKLQADWKSVHKAGTRDVDSDDNFEPGSKKQKHRVVLYLHGGAYYLSSAAAQRLLSIPLSKYTDARVFALDYRLAPETCFPGPLHDAASAYFRLIDDLHIPPENILLAGDSAGGGLALALLLYLRDNNYPLPSGAILMSPWVDLTMSCESLDSNSAFDVVPVPAPDDYLNPVQLYLGENMEKYLTHPYASPLFGDFKGLPPLLIQAGDAEVLRDEITLLAHKASLAGVEVQHEVYEDAIHVFQAYPFLEASRRSFMSCRDFVRNVIPRHQSRSPQVLDGAAEAELEQEIDNDKVCVVSGDGVETASGRHNVKEEMAATDEKQESDESSSQEEYPSWGRNDSLSPSPPSSEDEASPDLDDALPPSHPSPDLRSLRRIKSALSVLNPETPTTPKYSAPPSPSTLIPTRNHRRTSSGSTRRPRFNTLSMSSMKSHPQSPSMRRKVTSASHPDITSLIEQWSNDGPANQTMLYKSYN